MQIQLNGEKRDIPEGMNVSSLLEHLGLNPARVAIERNLEILPKAQWQATLVAAGDRFEIVHFVGGGESETTGRKPLASLRNMADARCAERQSKTGRDKKRFDRRSWSPQARVGGLFPAK